MNAKHCYALGGLLALCSLSGCDRVAEPKLSAQAIATRDAPAEHVFRGNLGGAPVFLLLHDCTVYRVETQGLGDVHWESVLALAPYPFWTVCERQSMAFADGVLSVTLGRMAVGAGGCCATGGTYRTRDARSWKKIA